MQTSAFVFYECAIDLTVVIRRSGYYSLGDLDWGKYGRGFGLNQYLW